MSLRQPAGGPRRAVPTVLVEIVALAAMVAGLLACSAGHGPLEQRPSPPRPYLPTRSDYFAFRDAHPEVLEPNYLPFMVHRPTPAGDAQGAALLLCRWSDASMPLAVLIETPAIPESLQNELFPVAPSAFEAAVASALASWERELEGLVRFRRVENGAEADLLIRLRAQRAPTPRPDVVVLGLTEALRDGCRLRGQPAEGRSRVEVAFAVPELVVYLADEHGLLAQDQVERIAVHEIGHALGMLGHSPSPSDIMYAAYRERSQVKGLTPSDVNSFVSLYRLPSGTVYALAAGGAAPSAPAGGPPAAPVQLALAPYVDAALGFELRLPAGWIHQQADSGVFIANGPGWSYDAAFEVSVSPQPTTEAFLSRNSRRLFRGIWFRRRSQVQVADRPALQVEVEDPSGRQAIRYWLVERSEGVVLLVARVPTRYERAWRPWIDAILGSVVLWSEGHRPDPVLR